MSETKTERDIAHEWQWPPYDPYDFWNDPGEDVYDENDGEPIDEEQSDD